MVANTIQGREHRAVPRFEYFARVIGEYPADAANPCFEGRIRNLSLNGVGLVLHRELEPGAIVSLTLYHAAGIYQCQRIVRVVDSRSDDERYWNVNCEFMAPLSVVELRLFEVQDFSPGYRCRLNEDAAVDDGGAAF